MNKFFFFVLLLFFQLRAFSSVPLPLSLELYSGYREDQFSFKVLSNTEEEELIYREKFDHPRYILTGVSLTTINNGFYFLTDLSYAPLITHKMHITDTDFDLNEYIFNHKAKGYDIGAYGELGIAANLTPDRIYKFYVIPFGGFSGFWKSYKRLGDSFAQSIDPSTGTISETMSFLSGKKLKQIWYGPYVGGKILIVPNGIIDFDLSYHFAWMKLKLDFVSNLEVERFDINDNQTLNEIITKDMDDTLSDCYGHFAEAKVTFNASRHIKVALFGRYNYYLSDNKKAVLITAAEEFFPEKNLFEQNTLNRVFSRWWNISGVFELILQF